MAGPVRQPVDLDRLSIYIKKYIPEIKLPVDIKQVRPKSDFCNESPLGIRVVPPASGFLIPRMFAC